MERKMRRFKQQFSEEECVKILEKATSGVLALCGADGWPYAVPLAYVYEGGKIYFHCAKTGHKLDVLAENPKASFCVTAEDNVVPEEYTTYYRSVIAFGAVRVMEEGSARRRALEILAAKYSPDQVEGRMAEIEKKLSLVTMLEMDVQRLTGKESMELTRMRNA